MNVSTHRLSLYFPGFSATQKGKEISIEMCIVMCVCFVPCDGWRCVFDKQSEIWMPIQVLLTSCKIAQEISGDQ